MPELALAMHSSDGRELEPWDLISLSCFAKWVSVAPADDEHATGHKAGDARGGQLVSSHEFLSRLDLVMSHAMGQIVKGPTVNENGQLMANIRTNEVETPKCFTTLLKVIASTAPQKPWEVKHKDDICVVEAIERKCVIVRAVLQLKGITPDLALEVLLDTSVRTKWDPVLETVTALSLHGARDEKDFSFDMSIETMYVYLKVKKQMGTGQRDCCQRWKVCRNDPSTGAHLVLIEDAVHDGAPETSKLVRMTTQIAGYVLKPSGEDSCEMTVINQTDVGGNVPTSMVNAFAVKAPVIWQGKIMRACKKKMTGKL